MRRSLAAALLGAGLLSGCALGPRAELPGLMLQEPRRAVTILHEAAPPGPHCWQHIRHWHCAPR
jgi:hypothetical protein